MNPNMGSYTAGLNCWHQTRKDRLVRVTNARVYPLKGYKMNLIYAYNIFLVSL